MRCSIRARLAVCIAIGRIVTASAARPLGEGALLELNAGAESWALPRRRLAADTGAATDGNATTCTSAGVKSGTAKLTADLGAPAAVTTVSMLPGSGGNFTAYLGNSTVEGGTLCALSAAPAAGGAALVLACDATARYVFVTSPAAFSVCELIVSTAAGALPASSVVVTATSGDGGGGGDKSWIIGVAIIPEFVIGGIVALVIYLRRKRRRKAQKLAAGASGVNTLTPAPWSDTCLDRSAITIDADPSTGEPIVLREGPQAKVVRGTLRGKEPVAVHVAPAARGADGAPSLPQELAVLRSLSCEQLVSFRGGSVSGEDMLLACELVEGGDLAAALHSGGSAALVRWADSGRSVALDAARGLAYLHSTRIVHLDLQPTNILLDASQTHAKVADVGFAHILKGSAPGEAGPYPAPEQLQGGSCGTKADIYSLGVVMWEVVTGEVPVRGSMRSVRVPDECSQAVADLIARCTADAPAERPTAAEVCELLAGEDAACIDEEAALSKSG